MPASAVQHESRSISTKERDIRVDDYLNDKFQTDADLDNIDSILLHVKNKQDLLKSQLVNAESALKKANRAAESHQSKIIQLAQDFNQQSADIDRRLLIVTRSETSDDAVRKFKGSMEKLQRLEMARGYVDLLKEADGLSSEAHRHIQSTPKAALEPYVRLQNLIIALKLAQPAAEGAAPHLIDNLDATTKKLREQIQDTLCESLEKFLKKTTWPESITITPIMENEWADCIGNLLDLQRPELEAREKEDTPNNGAMKPLVLLPFSVLVRDMEKAFTVHFYGKKPTNRPDKPELFLEYTFTLVQRHGYFFARHVQPILRTYFNGTILALNPAYIDSTNALITSLLPMIRTKLVRVVENICDNPQLFSHLMHELMKFDAKLRDEYHYTGGCGTEVWKGLTGEVLNAKNYFNIWLSQEQTFTSARYQDIVHSADGGETDYDSVEPGDTKPTKGTVRVYDLLNSVTGSYWSQAVSMVLVLRLLIDEYRLMVSFSHKLRFLIDIQITIFDLFHDRLNESLEAYLSMTNALALAMNPVSKDERAKAQGIGGLDCLCRVYGSADYLERAMSDWSDDVFFLELWQEIQHRARKRQGPNLAHNLTRQEVIERASSAVGAEDESGALFDETSGAYRKLRSRAEGLLVDQLVHDNREALRPYGRINPWSSLYMSDPNTAPSVTAELDGPLDQLNNYLSFLSGVISRVPLRNICRKLAAFIQQYIWDHVLMKHNFSTSGATQFSRDFVAMCSVMDKHLGDGQAEQGMRRLKEGALLLGLPVRAATEQTEDGVLGLWEVEKRLFENNESAREILEELGITNLSETLARQVLKRRVELDS
ncbi:MAG: hypothetical protein M1827_000214 [Pycnora praestabilis]|nr:MAG: hypothetical protein M1827_000214 [Pycnora praestabilis]